MMHGQTIIKLFPLVSSVPVPSKLEAGRNPRNELDTLEKRQICDSDINGTPILVSTRL